MARKKQQKKRLKKYQGKYVTADRLDMSKGGRVSLAHGGQPTPPNRSDFPTDKAYAQAMAGKPAEPSAIRRQCRR